MVCVFFCAIQRRKQIGMATQRFNIVMTAHNSMLTELKSVEVMGVVAQMRIVIALMPGAVLSSMDESGEFTYRFVQSRRGTGKVCE